MSSQNILDIVEVYMNPGELESVYELNAVCGSYCRKVSVQSNVSKY